MIPRLKYEFDEQKLDTLLYMYHRHVQRAILVSQFHERETLVAQQNLKQGVLLLLQSAVHSIDVQIPVLSNEIQNGFEYFLERHCDVVIRGTGQYSSDVFTSTLPFLLEGFSQIDINSDDALWFTDALATLKSEMSKHSSLAEDVYQLYDFYRKTRNETSIRFPRRVQKLLDKKSSRLPFVMEQSVRMQFETQFQDFLHKTKNKHQSVLSLMSILNANLFDFASVL
jgi:hypothetical protein